MYKRCALCLRGFDTSNPLKTNCSRDCTTRAAELRRAGIDPPVQPGYKKGESKPHDPKTRIRGIISYLHSRKRVSGASIKDGIILDDIIELLKKYGKTL